MFVVTVGVGREAELRTKTAERREEEREEEGKEIRKGGTWYKPIYLYTICMYMDTCIDM
jgi:hypothetical protein